MQVIFEWVFHLHDDITWPKQNWLVDGLEVELIPFLFAFAFSQIIQSLVQAIIQTPTDLQILFIYKVKRLTKPTLPTANLLNPNKLLKFILVTQIHSMLFSTKLTLQLRCRDWTILSHTNVPQYKHKHQEKHFNYLTNKFLKELQNKTGNHACWCDMKGHGMSRESSHESGSCIRTGFHSSIL